MLKLFINNTEHKVEALPQMRLIDLLRVELKLTGTKEGCGEGECGACSVILNGEVVNSCLILVGQLNDGDEITTIEGIKVHQLQRAFIEKGAVQCGMCTPGMIIAAYALLKKNPKPSREEIAKAISGNLCRCTGYAKIIDAIEEVSKMMK